jgi:hypothetical protein
LITRQFCRCSAAYFRAGMWNSTASCERMLCRPGGIQTAQRVHASRRGFTECVKRCTVLCTTVYRTCDCMHLHAGCMASRRACVTSKRAGAVIGCTLSQRCARRPFQ